VSEHCPDCQACPGDSHKDGCDVARCTVCGWQRISCDHGNTGLGWGAIWTGEWPGDVEVREYGLADLNDLAMMAARGQLWWDGRVQRWQRAVP
jgi:hypothetical protein